MIRKCKVFLQTLFLLFVILSIQKDVFAKKLDVKDANDIRFAQVISNKTDFVSRNRDKTVVKRGNAKSISKKTTRYKFRNFNDWEYRHQDTASIVQYSLEKGKLFLSTRANTYDRTKVNLTATKLKTGRSSCRVYVPSMYPFDQTSIASFLYSDDRHEVDFEIGYGNAKTRTEHQSQADEVLCYMTSQANPFQSEIINLKMNRWYVLDLDITLKNGKYFIQWFINGEQKASLTQNYGAEIEFRAVLSLENLKFLGEHIPKNDYKVVFDYLDITHYKNK